MEIPPSRIALASAGSNPDLESPWIPRCFRKEPSPPDAPAAPRFLSSKAAGRREQTFGVMELFLFPPHYR
jgi:hypothetical protein